jgi:peptidoglycan/xylan/chitin deacetylase (PgdA/CDA1 family)
MRRLLLLAALLSTSRGREVAITIDDLPRGGDIRAAAADTRAMTVKLLAPFAAGRIPLTGFVNECRGGSGLEALLTLWLRAGAGLGNHTCSHLDLNTTPVETYTADIERGETVTRAVLGASPRYFRYPFLHAGQSEKTKPVVEKYLKARGYRIAPVTLDNSDYVFAAVYARALARGDQTLPAQVRAAYLQYMESIADFFEKRSTEVFGREIRQVLLIHANQLNADVMPELLAMFRKRGYSIVTLDRALEDPVYSLPDEYVGPGGFSWIHRWSLAKGLPPKGEPDEPAWIAAEFRKR